MTLETAWMKNIKWYRGKPPFVGWWCTHPSIFESLWRWWDGRRWSYSIEKNMSAKQAKMLSNEKLFYTTGIAWCAYWPENARVPRLCPKCCEGAMQHGKALVSSTGTADFGDGDTGVCTMSLDPQQLVMIDCWKCDACGYSVSAGDKNG